MIEHSTTSAGCVAAFDVDGTLTRVDSLPYFIRHCIGFDGSVALGLRHAFQLLALRLGFVDVEETKAELLVSAFSGLHRTQIEGRGLDFAVTVLPRLMRPHMIERLERHRQLGHRIVLVSGGLGVYLRPWARLMGLDGCLSTELEFDTGGHLTGFNAEGQCVGPEKEYRLREWLELHGGCRELYAYGNSEGDDALLAMADHAAKNDVVLKGRPLP